MSAFETLSLMKLYSMAEQNFKNGRGDKKVWIEAKKADKIILISTYDDICSLFNRGKQMTWEHLFKVLSLKMKNTVVVLGE